MDVTNKLGVRKLQMEYEDAVWLLGQNAADRIFNKGGVYTNTAIAEIIGQKYLYLRDIFSPHDVWAISIPASLLLFSPAHGGDGLEMLKHMLQQELLVNQSLVALAVEIVDYFANASVT